MSNEDEGMSATVKTVLFVVVMAVVLGLFFYLSSLDRPPNMPAGITHTLRINTQAKLIGLGPEKVDPRTGRPAAMDAAVEYDEKKVETRVNTTCQQCHGVPAQDNTNHPCQKRTGKCVPVNHPPKLTCIKCHRQKNPGKDPKPGEKVVNMPLFELPGQAAGVVPSKEASKEAAPAPADTKTAPTPSNVGTPGADKPDVQNGAPAKAPSPVVPREQAGIVAPTPPPAKGAPPAVSSKKDAPSKAEAAAGAKAKAATEAVKVAPIKAPAAKTPPSSR